MIFEPLTSVLPILKIGYKFITIKKMKHDYLNMLQQAMQCK